MAKLIVEQALLKAKSHVKKGKIEEAQKLYKMVLQAFPKNKRAQQGLAAISGSKQTIVVKEPPHEPINQLVTLYNQGQMVLVVEEATSLIEQYPEAFIVWNIMGAAYKGLGRVQAAADAFQKVTELNPNYASGFNNMGNALQDQGKLDEAIASFKKALSLKPNYANAYNNMGNALKNQGKLDEATASYKKALSLKPDFAEAHNNMGRLCWLQGNFKIAFELLEYRWLTEKYMIGEALKTTKPKWQGEEERLFFWKEQGIGDEIMFSSLLIEAEQKASSLTVECDRRLKPIYKRSFPPSIKFITERKKVDEQDYDSHQAIGSLFKHFRNDIRDFKKSAAGWLKADQARANNYRNLLLSKPNSKLIGLSWFTKAKRAYSHLRNIEVEQFSDHLNDLPFDFVSLQYGLSKKELAEINSNIQLDILSVNGLDLFNDIDGLASLVAACDIVVSVDNINVHLAGALGVDTRVILPKVADERWGLGGEESYLYDSVKIYRQTNSEDWSAPLLGLEKDLLDGFQ